MLTKKEYETLAKVIATARIFNAEDTLISKESLVLHLCVVLHNDNPRFDVAKFTAACNG